MGQASKEVRDLVAALKVEVNDVRMKVNTTKDLMRNIFTFLGDIETRLEAFRTLGVRGGLFSPEEYDKVWDEIKGLRVKAPTEVIHAGDFVRMSFTASDKDGNELLNEEGVACVVGNKAFVFEDKVIGMRVGVGSFDFEHTYPKDFPLKPELADKTLAFNMTIDKVKTKCITTN